MRVLLTHASLNIGGAETHLIELAKAFKNSNVKVFVATNGGIYEKELIKNNITHFKVPLHSKKPLDIFNSVVKLKKIIRKEKIEIIHAHSRIAAFISRVFFDMPLVVTAHFFPNNNFIFRNLSKWGDITLAVSEDIRDELVQKFDIKEENTIVTVNGINPKVSKAKENRIFKMYDINRDTKKIISVTRLENDTSAVPENLIKIAEDLDNKIGNIEIIIVGDGEKFLNLQKKAEIINEKVGRYLIHLVGPQVNVLKFLKISNVFVGVSRSAFEAMLCKKPIILAGNSGYFGIFESKNLIAARRTNFCCRGYPKISRTRLKNDIIELMTNKKRAEKISKDNKKIILSVYSIEKMKKDAIIAYEKAINLKSQTKDES